MKFKNILIWLFAGMTMVILVSCKLNPSKGAKEIDVTKSNLQGQNSTVTTSTVQNIKDKSINNKEKTMNYTDSCKFLQSLGLIDNGEIPILLDRMPKYDDKEPFGINFLRSSVIGVQLKFLNIPRTYFSRSEIRNVLFTCTNLSESNMCWNDFNEVDFTNANLSKCDMRSSIFENVKFNDANLENVDLRHSSFEKCDFTGANLEGVRVTREVGNALRLSDDQVRVIKWEETDGDEPDGG